MSSDARRGLRTAVAITASGTLLIAISRAWLPPPEHLAGLALLLLTFTATLTLGIEKGILAGLLASMLAAFYRRLHRPRPVLTTPGDATSSSN